MFPELNNLCDFGLDALPSGKSLVIGESDCDGSFILNHMTALYLRAGNNVCFVGLAQSFNHYNSVGNKIGVSLAKCKESGNLVFLEGLKALTEQSVCVVEAKQQGEQLPEQFIAFGSESQLSLKSLYTLVKETVLRLDDTNGKSTLVIIDDVSMLLALGIPHHFVSLFLQYLRSLLNSKTGKNGCLLVLCHGVDSEDDTGMLWKQLCYSSDFIFKTKGLDSGYCRDVHGQLIIQRRNASPEVYQADQFTTMQFKINDKNVTFFAPGMSSAVL